MVTLMDLDEYEEEVGHSMATRMALDGCEAKIEGSEEESDLVAPDCKDFVLDVNILDGPRSGPDLMAAKQDDAKVDVVLWDRGLWEHFGISLGERPRFSAALATLRKYLVGRWCKQVYQDYRCYMRGQYRKHWLIRALSGSQKVEWQKDIDAGHDCLERAVATLWWEWRGRYRLFFYRRLCTSIQCEYEHKTQTAIPNPNASPAQG